MDDLIAAAREALTNAHVPYSEYRVGAALETADGTVYTGCNIENANYSNSLHAEEVALAEAVKNGHREFERIAVSSGVRDGVTPCGMCRQSARRVRGRRPRRRLRRGRRRGRGVHARRTAPEHHFGGDARRRQGGLTPRALPERPRRNYF
ncbi:MAG: cytidine deaminase [Balneolaceae bacterium]|nr:cytidine deaminase [Balneolaceae bacterium]